MASDFDITLLIFDPDSGRVSELELTQTQYTTLVAMAGCPVVLSGTGGGAAAPCSEPLLLPCAGWTALSGQADERTLTGDWLCALDHGPNDYVASLPTA